MRRLLLDNHQRRRSINLPALRKIGAKMLNSLIPERQFQIAVHLVDEIEMAVLNETFLKHSGSTDVITFDYADGNGQSAIEGEIFISIDDAVIHSTRFRSTWQEETARYLAHGIFHLMKFEDATPAQRRSMRHRESCLLQAIAKEFPAANIGKEA